MRSNYMKMSTYDRCLALLQQTGWSPGSSTQKCQLEASIKMTKEGLQAKDESASESKRDSSIT